MSAGSILDKSWLFEVFDKRSNSVEKSFTLIFPPQQITIREPQRVNITKTLDGVFVDDYGPDNLEIVLSGISGTASVFPTFRTTGGGLGFALSGSAQTVFTSFNNIVSQTGATEGYDQKTAFYAFRDDIMRYKDRGSWETKELRVYDLYDGQAYKCVLQEFTLDRRSNLPFRYPFMIRLFVYQRMNSYDNTAVKPIPLAVDNPAGLLSEINSSMEWLGKAAAFATKVKNTVDNIKNTAQLMLNRINSNVVQILGVTSIIQDPLQIANSLVNFSGQLITDVANAYSNSVFDVKQYANFSETSFDTLSKALAVWNNATQNDKVQSQTHQISTDAGLNVNASDISGNSNDRYATQSSLSYTGYKLYTVSSGDTLQSIALQQLGDETLWPFIALVNKITGNSGLTANSQILIPVSVNSPSNQSQFITTSAASTDPLGTDISLDYQGNMSISNNDVLTVSGFQNLLQAINVRLQNTLGSMVKQAAFGLSTSAGFPNNDLALSYLKMSTENSLMQDPRVQQVSNVQVILNGGQIFIGADIQVVGYPTTLPVTASI